MADLVSYISGPRGPAYQSSAWKLAALGDPLSVRRDAPPRPFRHVRGIGGWLPHGGRERRFTGEGLGVALTGDTDRSVVSGQLAGG